MKQKNLASLIFWIKGNANPPIIVDPDSPLGKKIPKNVETLNVTLLTEEAKEMIVDFDGNKIKEPEQTEIKNLAIEYFLGKR